MVSVILPNYNHAPFLKKRIDSILNQTFQDFELIILDDKSPDNSKEIIEQYRNNSHVSHIIYNEENSGSTFKQWNKGISLAKGEYIWIAESDDYSDKSFLEEAIDLMHKTNATITFSLSYIVDKDDNILYKKDEIIKYETITSLEFLNKHLCYNNSIYNASMSLFRRDAIININWNKLLTFKYCGDWFFWSELLKNKLEGNVSEVKKHLNYFRTHSNNVSNRSEKNGLTILEGFPISKGITKYLRKEDRHFAKEWRDKWRNYHHIYSFSKKTNNKIFYMFLKKQPIIVYYQLTKQLYIFFKK